MCGENGFILSMCLYYEYRFSERVGMVNNLQKRDWCCVVHGISLLT